MVLHEVFAPISSHLVHTIPLQNGNYYVYGHLKGTYQSSKKLYFLAQDQIIGNSWH